MFAKILTDEPGHARANIKNLAVGEEAPRQWAEYGLGRLALAHPSKTGLLLGLSRFRLPLACEVTVYCLMSSKFGAAPRISSKPSFVMLVLVRNTVTGWCNPRK